MSSEQSTPTPPTMSEGDMKFLISCLTNSVGGTISVDVQAVATELNFANPRSIANKFAKYKKDFGIILSSGKPNSSATDTTKTPAATPKKRTAKAANIDDGEEGTAKTPSPARKKATPRKRASKAKVEVVKTEEENEEGKHGSAGEGEGVTEEKSDEEMEA